VGTANLDNRSFRLNFEITVATTGEHFAREVETLLASDFARCRLAASNELSGRSLLFRLAVRLSRLMSPIQ
jgi:cardiolipin synthase